MENLYKTEADPDVKERLLLLVLKVERDDEMIPSHVGKELHRSRTWASDWLARYRIDGIEGLRDR